jgi:hypothetical protein
MNYTLDFTHVWVTDFSQTREWCRNCVLVGSVEMANPPRNMPILLLEQAAEYVTAMIGSIWFRSLFRPQV